MPLQKDFPISLDEAQLISAYGDRLDRLLKDPARLEIFRDVLDELRLHVKPAACWERFRIAKRLHERLVLANGVRIGGGPVVSVVSGATELIVAVCTIGAGVDRLMEESQSKKQFFKSMLLHDLSALAVDRLRQELCLTLEKEFAGQGLRVSAPLSPGESVWSVKDQAVIFSLLDASQIGMTLNSSMVMSPSRSLSLIMGAGSQPMGVEGATNCDFCTIKERCSYRRARLNVQPS